jgi:hypothetical protein
MTNDMYYETAVKLPILRTRYVSQRQAQSARLKPPIQKVDQIARLAVLATPADD